MAIRPKSSSAGKVGSEGRSAAGSTERLSKIGRTKTSTAKNQRALPSYSLTPTSTEIRKHIAHYVKQVATKCSRFSVLARGKEVAVLGPVGSLPKGQPRERIKISTTDIANGKVKFSGVVHHGPYEVTRSGKVAAVLYSPIRSERSKIDEVLNSLDELRILDEEKKRRVELRGRVDKAIQARINLLRQVGDPAADHLEDAWKELDRQI